MEPFYDRLTGLGYDVWIDKDGIESGDAFKKTILRAIKSSRCVVFFSSANSNASDWTAKEIGVAVKNRIPIIPVRIDGSDYNEEVQFDLVNLDYTDYSKTEERENQLEKFLRSIKKKLGEKTPVPVEAPPAKPEIASGCELHFGTDLPCDIYQFKKKVGHVEPDGDFSLNLPPGNYKFEFVSSVEPGHRYSVLHHLDGMAYDFIGIELKNNGSHQPKEVPAPVGKTAREGLRQPLADKSASQTHPEAAEGSSKRINESSVIKNRIGRDYPSTASVAYGLNDSPQGDSQTAPESVLSEGKSSVFLKSANLLSRHRVAQVLEKYLSYDKDEAKMLASMSRIYVASNLSASSAEYICEALKSAGAKASVENSIIYSAPPGKKGRKYELVLQYAGWKPNYVISLIEGICLGPHPGYYWNAKRPVSLGVFDYVKAARIYETLIQHGASVDFIEQQDNKRKI